MNKEPNGTLESYRSAFAVSTPGEWGSVAPSSDMRNIRYITGDLGESIGMIVSVRICDGQSQDEAIGNANFIREAHNLAPRLLNAVDVLNEFVSDCEAAAGWLEDPKAIEAEAIEHLDEEWPDLAVTYKKAKQAIQALNTAPKVDAGIKMKP